MAILRGGARLLLEEHRRRPFSGSVLELGKMLVFFSQDDLHRWAGRHRVALTPVEEPSLSHDPRLAAQACMDDRTFFSTLGFKELVSCDVSDYEGADFVADLNEPIPAELEGRFDVVYESGTLQHIFHLPNVLRNIHMALKPEGRVIIGMAASHNHVDHGFYMFSPTLFYDYFAANGYEVNTARLFEFTPFWLDGKMYTSRWKIYDYSPGSLDHLSYGGFGRSQVALFFVATKKPRSTCTRIPQQGYYRQFWQETKEAAGRAADDPQQVAADSITVKEGVEGRLARAARRSPALLKVLLTIKHLRRRIWQLWQSSPGRKPKLIAKY